NVVHFTNSFHGMTLGSLAVTGNAKKRGGAGVPLNNSSVIQYGDKTNPSDFAELLDNSSSGVDKPAAIILEIVQGEGGLNTPSNEWIQEIVQVCKNRNILVIVDEVQTGCGRTGTFFAFD